MNFVTDSDKPHRLVKFKELFLTEEVLHKHWPMIFGAKKRVAEASVASSSKVSSLETSDVSAIASTSKGSSAEDQPVTRAEFRAFKVEVIKSITTSLDAVS